jgi:hypothetical protein
MINLNEEQSKAVEDMAYCLIPLPLIAVNLEIEEFELKELLREPSPVRTAYYRGYIRQKMEVQRSIIQAAQNGSNPAIEQLVKMLGDISNQLKYG